MLRGSFCGFNVGGEEESVWATSEIRGICKGYNRMRSLKDSLFELLPKIPEGRDGGMEKHALSSVSHDGDYLLTHKRFVAMCGTFATNLFVFCIGTL